MLELRGAGDGGAAGCWWFAEGMWIEATGPVRVVGAADWSGQARGYPVGGPQDRFSAASVNRLVGNPDQAPLIEWDLGRLQVTASAPTRVAVGGAMAPASINGSAVARWQTLDLQAGDTLRVGPLAVRGPGAGVHGYLALAGGGVEVAESGPEADVAADAALVAEGEVGADAPTRPTVQTPLTRPGAITVVPAGVTAATDATTEAAAAIGEPLPLVRRMGGWAAAGAWAPRAGVLRCVPGPEWSDGLLPLLGGPWRVSGPRSRMGLALRGPRLPASYTVDIASGPVCDGCVQLTADGALLLTRDRGSLGGYARGWVVIGCDVDLAAQLPPGAAVRFELVTPDEAQAARLAQAACLDLCVGLSHDEPAFDQRGQS